MTAEEISRIIENELKETKDFFNPHDVDLKTAIIKPVQQIYYDSLQPTQKLILWTVLEETPDKEGYKIFYSETEGVFGLGMLGRDKELIALGYYGDFINTLSCM